MPFHGGLKLPCLSNWLRGLNSYYEKITDAFLRRFGIFLWLRWQNEWIDDPGKIVG